MPFLIQFPACLPWFPSLPFVVYLYPISLAPIRMRAASFDRARVALANSVLLEFFSSFDGSTGGGLHEEEKVVWCFRERDRQTKDTEVKLGECLGIINGPFSDSASLAR